MKLKKYYIERTKNIMEQEVIFQSRFLSYSKIDFPSSIQFEPIKYSASATNQSTPYPYYQGPNHVHPYEETRILPLTSTVVSASDCKSEEKCAKNSDVSQNSLFWVIPI